MAERELLVEIRRIVGDILRLLKSGSPVVAEEPVVEGPPLDRASRLLQAWKVMFERVNENPNLPRMFPPPATIFESEQAVELLGETIDAFDDDELVDEMRRICRYYQGQKFVITFKGVVKMIGQPLGDTNPVIWKGKNADGTSES